MIKRDQIDALNAVLSDLESDLERGPLGDAAGRTDRALWVRLLTALVALLALSNLYFVNDLTDEVALIIDRAQQMTDVFGRVAERMDQIRAEVDDIDQSVVLMPVVSAQMREMASHVQVMGQSVTAMDRSTEGLGGAVATMDGTVRDMTMRFYDLNRTLGAVRIDVDQMARPVP
jgi:methyl-accepting chemotaxis protein